MIPDMRCLLLVSAGASVDWWSLGVLMFEMLAGCSPWMQPGQGIPPEENTEDYLFNCMICGLTDVPLDWLILIG